MNEWMNESMSDASYKRPKYKETNGERDVEWTESEKAAREGVIIMKIRKIDEGGEN